MGISVRDAFARKKFRWGRQRGMTVVSYPCVVRAIVVKKSVCAHWMAGASVGGMPSANSASIDVFCDMSAACMSSSDLPVMVNRAPGMTGLGMYRAGWSPLLIACKRTSLCAWVMGGKTNTPCRAGSAGVVAVGRSSIDEDRRRLRDGDGEHIEGEGERRRLVGSR